MTLLKRYKIYRSVFLPIYKSWWLGRKSKARWFGLPVDETSERRDIREERRSESVYEIGSTGGMNLLLKERRPKSEKEADYTAGTSTFNPSFHIGSVHIMNPEKSRIWKSRPTQDFLRFRTHARTLGQRLLLKCLI